MQCVLPPPASGMTLCQIDSTKEKHEKLKGNTHTGAHVCVCVCAKLPWRSKQAIKKNIKECCFSQCASFVAIHFLCAHIIDTSSIELDKKQSRTVSCISLRSLVPCLCVGIFAIRSPPRCATNPLPLASLRAHFRDRRIIRLVPIHNVFT